MVLRPLSNNKQNPLTYAISIPRLRDGATRSWWTDTDQFIHTDQRRIQVILNKASGGLR